MFYLKGASPVINGNEATTFFVLVNGIVFNRSNGFLTEFLIGCLMN